MTNSRRISELDGLRAIAAFTVLVFHYFFRWDDVLPYGSELHAIAKFGFLGVNLFFIISGFVIFMSLERSPSAAMFAKQRAIRLLPAMVICSTITFFAMWLIETPFTEFRRQDWTGFLPSWTFTPPKIWQLIYPVGGWMDGVYWTLYIEVKFYFMAAMFYFLAGKIQFRNAVIVFLIIGAATNFLFSSTPGISTIVDHAFFPKYLPFFCAGIALYDIHQGRYGGTTLSILIISIALSIAVTSSLPNKLLVACFYVIFFILIFRRSWVSWLSHPLLVAIGVASYPLYLVHQNLGVGLMSLFSSEVMHSWFYVISTLVTVSMIILSLAIHRWVEKPVEILFKRSIDKETRVRTQSAS